MEGLVRSISRAWDFIARNFAAHRRFHKLDGVDEQQLQIGDSPGVSDRNNSVAAGQTNLADAAAAALTAQQPPMQANRRAFLSMIGFSEGTSTSPATKNNGFDVIVTGIDRQPEIFTDYSNHPFDNGRKSKIINSRGLTSNASGRYQFMLRDWHHYRDLLQLENRMLYPSGAFSPAAQDAWAIQLIRERGALPLIDAGDFALAVRRVSNLWASLPGANYPGQRMHTIKRLTVAYVDAGGVLA